LSRKLNILCSLCKKTGYGQRYLTARNQITLPCSVPGLRHPPPTARFLRVTSPTKQCGNDFRAQKRNADQILLQTSGEIGKFYVDPESVAVKLGKKPLTRPTRREYGTQLQSSGQEGDFTVVDRASMSGRNDGGWRDTSFSGANSSRLSTQRDQDSSSSSRLDGTGLRDSLGGGADRACRFEKTGSALYTNTLMSLDKTFSNGNRRDLFAASLPVRPSQELVWCASSNSRGAQQAKGWMEKLRKDPVT
jgi:hypothetical protein